MHESVELDAFCVFGIRCLAAADWVPVARPTILTGANDGGKTSLLLAIAFLLEGKGLTPDDLTLVKEDEDPACGAVDGRYAEAWVEGRFSLQDDEAARLGVDPEVSDHGRRRPPATDENGVVVRRRRVCLVLRARN